MTPSTAWEAAEIVALANAFIIACADRDMSVGHGMVALTVALRGLMLMLDTDEHRALALEEINALLTDQTRPDGLASMVSAGHA